VRLGASAVGDAAGGFQLTVPYDHRAPAPTASRGSLVNRPPTQSLTLTGEAALAAARRLLPRINGTGASASRVREATALLAELGGGADAFREAARRVPRWAAQQAFGDTGALVHLPPAVRLALEMAAHEALEQAQSRGELAALEATWRDAAMIAGILDALVLPPSVVRAHEELRARSL
jgi:hypothetical protein